SRVLFRSRDAGVGVGASNGAGVGIGARPGVRRGIRGGLRPSFGSRLGGLHDRSDQRGRIPRSIGVVVGGDLAEGFRPPPIVEVLHGRAYRPRPASAVIVSDRSSGTPACPMEPSPTPGQLWHGRSPRGLARALLNSQL